MQRLLAAHPPAAREADLAGKRPGHYATRPDVGAVLEQQQLPGEEEAKGKKRMLCV